MKIKKTIGFIHLWLGLLSGLVVFIVSITGCIYAFQEEIQNITQPYRFVESKTTKALLPSQLKSIAETQIDSSVAKRIRFGDINESASVDLAGPDGSYYNVYIDPYNGHVLKVKNYKTDFFVIILYLHMYLLLPYKIGGFIVSTATIIFVIMLITGIVLWWPKNKSAAKQRFSIKWNAKWRRVNYDMHNVLGFYMSWVIVFIALTGLVWGFEWFAKSTYWISSGGKPMPEYQNPQSDTTASIHAITFNPVDQTFLNVKKETPTAQAISISFPDKKESAITVYANLDKGTYYKLDCRYFDQYTLKELSVKHYRGRYKDASIADMVMRLNYDIHVGAIFGFAGKLIAFFASLIAASLPITGVYIWWGRKNKKSKKENSKPKHQDSTLKILQKQKTKQITIS